MAKSKKPDTMSISLSPQQRQFVRNLVSAGDYQNPSDVLREGVRLLQKQSAMRDELKAKLDEARRDIRSGRWYTADEVMGEWARLDALATKRTTKRKKSA